LKKHGVEELSGCAYREVNDQGLLIERNGKTEVLEVYADIGYGCYNIHEISPYN
jgi:hypothetical protein